MLHYQRGYIDDQIPNPQLWRVSVDMRQAGRKQAQQWHRMDSYGPCISVYQQLPNSDRSCLQVRIQGAGDVGRHMETCPGGSHEATDSSLIIYI